MARNCVRVSKRERSRVLNDMLGKYRVSDYKVSNDNNLNHRTASIIRELSSINRKDMIRQLKIINDLHKKVSLILTTLSHSTQSDILVVNRKDITRISKTIQAFNHYITINQLYLLKYQPLEEIKLPNDVLVYCTKCHVSERGYNNEHNLL